MFVTETENIPARKLSTLARNYTETARLMKLVYVNNSMPGITRKKKGKSFLYFYNGRQVKNAKTLKRIAHLVIPPAWENVWISPDEKGHIQVTGIDVRGRKQYRYHPGWIALRDKTKYYRLRAFGNVIPQVRQRLAKDLAHAELDKNKVLALVISLMERTNIRVGNNAYEKEYGSYGLSTLKDQHVNISGSNIKFSFVGKKGVRHNITLKNKRLAGMVKKCRDIPGKELFQYRDKKGRYHSIGSGDVNAYIHELTGGDFTSKDFRTWAGSVQCLLAFKELGQADTVTAIKRNVAQAFDKVAECLGNTRAVCKKHYVHPAVVSCYEDKKLARYLKQLDKVEKGENNGAMLTNAEKVLLKILGTN